MTSVRPYGFPNAAFYLLAPYFGIQSNEVMWMNEYAFHSNVFNFLIPTHPLLRNLSNPYEACDTRTATPWPRDLWTGEVLDKGEIVAISSDKLAAIIVNEKFSTVYFSNFTESGWTENNEPTDDDYQIWYNAILWSSHLMQREVIEPLFKGQYSCPDFFRPKDGDVNNDGRPDWLYETVLDDLMHTFELWGVDPTWRLFDEYFALIFNGKYLIGKCVFSGGRNTDYMIHTGDADDNNHPDRIKEVVWESRDEGGDDVGTPIWPGFTSVVGKDSLSFEYDVQKNELRVTHYDGEGFIINSQVGPPAQPTHSWAWNSVPIAELQYEENEIMTVDPAISIDLEPDTLNLKASGNQITTYIELPTSYDVKDIDASTVKMSKINGTELENPISAEEQPTKIDDYDNDGIRDLMVKFNRKKLITILSNMGFKDGDVVKVTVGGNLKDGKSFEGRDRIRVNN